MSSLELKIPPDVVWLGVAGLMWLIAKATPVVNAGEPFRRVAAVLLIVTGTGLIVGARLALERAGTTWRPTEPERTTKLVTSGVYRFSRNPIYVGMMLVLLSWAVVLASPLAGVVSAVFVAYIDRFQIVPEERMLAAHLGQAYSDYARCVRRWI